MKTCKTCGETKPLGAFPLTGKGSHRRPNCRPCYLERKRDLELVRVYGITREDKNSMLASQGGACKICGGSNHRGKDWHVDHCHTTSAVRGILCSPCNSSLGLLREDIQVLRSAIAYLEDHAPQRAELSMPAKELAESR
jgi:hypothetical protein